MCKGDDAILLAKLVLQENHIHEKVVIYVQIHQCD